MKKNQLARLFIRLAKFLPVHYPIKGRLDQQPFFLLGSGRNGSTLMNRILNQHEMLCLPPEQYFLATIIMKFQIYNWMSWPKLIQQIGNDLNNQKWELNVTETMEKLLDQQDKSLQGLVDTIYRQTFAAKRDARWGDTTYVNTTHIRDIYAVFPDAAYLFLLRDGRDVVASFQAGGESYLGQYAEPGPCIAHWKASIRQYDWLRQQTPVHLIQYEDLVQNPEEVLTGVCEFLDLPYQQSMLDFYNDKPTAAMYQEPQHHNINNRVDANSVGRWKEELGQEALKLIDQMDVELKRFNYL